MQHIHIVGICGTFMGSIAMLAKSLGYKVTGADEHVYPPMSTQLEAAGIEVVEGFGPEQLSLNPDLYIIGNVISRGNPLMEAILDKMLPYTSGPQWFADHVLKDRWVLAVSGTHGKTTTSSMLAWLLDCADMSPGFLIGGVPQNFGVSARLGDSGFFVVEADEYDSAFFDKRSKFIHYKPNTLVINNLEFDHADIFPNIEAIQKQFHHLVRIIPKNGLICYPKSSETIEETLAYGCWTPLHTMGEAGSDEVDWGYRLLVADGSKFEVYFEGALAGQVEWSLTGTHNVQNAVAAIAAARNVGVVPELSCRALASFKGVKRRLELYGECHDCRVYDDFAHHPTAINLTLEGLRAKVGEQSRITAIIEPRSSTMKQGVHKDKLLEACHAASEVIWYESPGLGWSIREMVEGSEQHQVFDEVVDIVKRVSSKARPGDHIVVMSNGGFGGIHALLLDALDASVIGNV